MDGLNGRADRPVGSQFFPKNTPVFLYDDGLVYEGRVLVVYHDTKGVYWYNGEFRASKTENFKKDPQVHAFHSCPTCSHLFSVWTECCKAMCVSIREIYITQLYSNLLS